MITGDFKTVAGIGDARPRVLDAGSIADVYFARYDAANAECP